MTFWTRNQRKKARSKKKKPKISWYDKVEVDGKLKTVRNKNHPLYEMRQEFDDTFRPVILNKQLAYIIGWMAWGEGREIVYDFRYTEQEFEFPIDDTMGSGVIDYAFLDQSADMRYGHVSRSAKSGAEMMDKQSVATNGQGHTHPGMGVWWSREDIKDQASDVNHLTFFLGSGERYFLVTDGVRWLMRRYRWWKDEDGEKQIRYCDAAVRNTAGQKLKYSDKKYTTNLGNAGTSAGTSNRLSPKKILDLMEEDEGIWQYLLPEEETEMSIYLYEEYGQGVFYLPDWMGLESNALLRAVNEVVFQHSFVGVGGNPAWDNFLRSSGEWGEMYGRGVSDDN